MTAKAQDFKTGEGVRWANKPWELLYRDMTAPSTTTEDISACLSALGLEGAGGAEELKELFAAGGTKLSHATGARVKSALGTLQDRAKAAAKAKAEAEVAGGAGEEAQAAAAAATKAIVDVLNMVDPCLVVAGRPPLSLEATAEGATPPFSAVERATMAALRNAIAGRIADGSKFSVGGLEAPAGARSQAEVKSFAHRLVKVWLGGPVLVLETEDQLATAGPVTLFASCSADLRSALANKWVAGHALNHDTTLEDARKHVGATIAAAEPSATVKTIKDAALRLPPSEAVTLARVHASSALSLNDAMLALLSSARPQQEGAETAKNVTASAALNRQLKDIAARAGGWSSLADMQTVYTVECQTVNAPMAAAAASLAIASGLCLPVAHYHQKQPAPGAVFINIQAARYSTAADFLKRMLPTPGVDVVGEPLVAVNGLDHTTLVALAAHLLYYNAVPASSASFQGAVSGWLAKAAAGDSLAREACGGTGNFAGPQAGLAEWALGKLDKVANVMCAYAGCYSSMPRKFDFKIAKAASYRDALTFLLEGVALAGVLFVEATEPLGALYAARAAHNSGKGAFGAGPPNAAPQCPAPAPPAGGGGGGGSGGGSSGREVHPVRKPPPAGAYPDGYTAPAVLSRELKDPGTHMQTAEEACWQCGVVACPTKHECNSRRGRKVFPLHGAKSVGVVIDRMYSAIAGYESA